LSIFAYLLHEVVEGLNVQEKWLTEVRFIHQGASTIKTFARWDRSPSSDIIARAKKSIEVIDSNCSEHFFWAGITQEALEKGASNLVVSIYMLDPNGSFGAQRLLEMMPHSGRKEAVVSAVCSPTQAKETMKVYKSKYLEEIIHNCNNLRKTLEQVKSKFVEKSVTLEIYHYPTMPCLRAIIVDESKYIFGWFPLNALNPLHACFFIDGSSDLTESDRVVIECLKHHIKEIKDDRSKKVDLTKDVTRESFNDEPS